MKKHIIILEGPQVLTNKVSMLAPTNFATVQDAIGDDMYSTDRLRQVVDKMMYKVRNIRNLLEHASAMSIFVPNFYDIHPVDDDDVVHFIKMHGNFFLDFILQTYDNVIIHKVFLSTDTNHHYELLIQHQMCRESCVYDIVRLKDKISAVTDMTVNCRTDILYTEALLRGVCQAILSEIVVNYNKNKTS